MRCCQLVIKIIFPWKKLTKNNTNNQIIHMFFHFVTKIVQSQFWIFGKKLFLSQKLRLLDLPRSEFNLLLFSFCSLPKLSRIRRRNKKTFGSFSNRIQRLCIRRFFQRVLNTKEVVGRNTVERITFFLFQRGRNCSLQYLDIVL